MPNLKLKTVLKVFFILFILNSCGTEVQDLGENYGDIIDSPSGLILTEDEHNFGWGRSDCLTCHNLNNIHLEDRSDIGIDVEAIQDETFTEGEAVCSSCHGENGL